MGAESHPDWHLLELVGGRLHLVYESILLSSDYTGPASHLKVLNAQIWNEKVFHGLHLPLVFVAELKRFSISGRLFISLR